MWLVCACQQQHNEQYHLVWRAMLIDLVYFLWIQPEKRINRKIIIILKRHLFMISSANYSYHIINNQCIINISEKITTTVGSQSHKMTLWKRDNLSPKDSSHIIKSVLAKHFQLPKKGLQGTKWLVPKCPLVRFSVAIFLYH